MILEENTFINENNQKMKHIKYGDSEGNVTSEITMPVVEESTHEREILTETEEAILNTNMNVEFLVAMQEMTI